MPEATSSIPPAVARLREALEQLADALAHPDLDRLLACQASIEAAVAELSSGTLQNDRPEAVRAHVEAARAALTRCRVLGASLDRFISTTNAARGNEAVYGVDAAVVAIGPHALNLTV